MSEQTPMIRQYLRIKAQHPDAILFFRLGDFYEMFFEDAETASRELDLTLTSRNKHAEERVPLCGVPYHAASSYIARLVSRGYKVAICEQVEDPRTAKGIVQREVTRVITPGVVLEPENLESDLNNFLMGITPQGPGVTPAYGLAYADISTGEFRLTESEELRTFQEEILRVDPKEVLIPEGFLQNEHVGRLYADRKAPLFNVRPRATFEFDAACRLLEVQFGAATIRELVATGYHGAICAAGAVLGYLQETQKQLPAHVHRIVPYEIQEYMILEDSTKRNLEIVQTLMERSKRHSLLGVLDCTVTAMGARKLRRWIEYPLLHVEGIVRRQDAVEEFKDKEIERAAIRGVLQGIQDLERLNGRICLAQGNARDLVALRNSVAKIPGLRERLKGCRAPMLRELQDLLDPLDDVVSLIGKSIVDEPPMLLREGGIVREGYHEGLDELRLMSRDGKRWIASLEAQEKTRTGISSLKIRYNRVFGYYIEVTKANLDLVPGEYQRKQTLANAERFTTPALKEYEEKVLGAEERAVELEYTLFQEIRCQVATASSRIRMTADGLAQIDVLATLAEVAARNRYCRPDIVASDEIVIWEGRHPVVEQMDLEERFVPNDIVLDGKENRTIILTGPNMAGKSTYMRQVALIVLMAQVGSFVSADAARIGLVDRIFTRIGAMDNLVRGQSTFMVEMIETSGILAKATARSLVLLDEIGRGTSTFDGVSIAWAVGEYIHKNLRARTLFATHYHELSELAALHPDIKNFNIAVKEWGDNILFLRKVIEGSVSHSYGIQVARLAGIPPEVIQRAREILGNLETGEWNEFGQPRIALAPLSRKRAVDQSQLSLFTSQSSPVLDEIRRLDISHMTPMQALSKLQELKERAGGTEDV